MNQATVTREVVLPSQNRWETALLIAAIAALLLFTGLYTASFGRQDPVTELQDWQISAFSELQGVDQAIYSELQVASEEIYWMHFYSNQWPDQEDFEDAFLAPFYRDLSWQRNGQVQWSMQTSSLEDGAGVTLYHGNHGTIAGQGAWMLLINHSHAGNTQVNDATIWWNADSQAQVPEITRDSSLILNGWQQVVPYQGRDEVQRLNAG